MNYYNFHIGDYLRDTAHLSLVEHGAYRRMLDLYYASEKPLPLDVPWLCRLVRADSEPERDAVRFVLQHFFQKFEDGWHHKRCAAEIALAATKAKVARRNGKKGGRPKTQRVSSGFLNGTQKKADAKLPITNNQEPITNNQEPKRNKETPPKLVASLPDWLPVEAWNAWLEVRAKSRAPNTASALSIALKKLERLKAEGHDPSAVLENAALRGWRGLFAPPRSGAEGDLSKLISEIEEEDKKRAAH